MNILLVTSAPGTPCGIAEHSQLLIDAVTRADPSITITPSAEALDPAWVVANLRPEIDLIHLNYHAALHSRWTPEAVRQIQSGFPTGGVVITYHDTGVPNSQQAKDLATVADALVVHEPCGDLVVPTGELHYWRQGVPVSTYPGMQFGWGGDPDTVHFRAYVDQPVLGTVGFPFPWKNYELLCRASARAGWALVLLAPGATPEQHAAWHALTPQLWVVSDFIPAQSVVAYLGGCDATAFCYTCANTGTSGAIRQGLAARKPVIAAANCRQFRDLYLDTIGHHAIRWIDPTEDGLVAALASTPIARVDPGVVALATQDSWAGLGRRYADLYHRLAGRIRPIHQVHSRVPEQP